ncbi:MAG: cytochrome c3 family protein, partial [Xanthomonadaceae bacterium]|nr:cytochrome c3 family protein [Xanthomonadaceae bacterium]
LRRTPLLPSTQSWNPGTLDAAHHFFARDCTRCHQTAFLTVRDKACLACHANTAAHADPVKFNLPQLGNAQCRTCHQDHQGLRGLIRRDQRLCSDCHADLKARTKGASSFADVSDFGTNHPEFKVNLPQWDANGKFAPVRTTWTADLKEDSGLKFNHEKHLKPEGLNTPNGHRVLTCATCHVPDAGGAKMRPVNFETMCHDCHKLGFDTLAPDREVPHGKVAAVAYTLSEYYAKVALEGGYQDARSPDIVQQRRRPGAPPLSQQQQQEALAWARQRAREATDSLFTGKACSTCHKVTPPRTPDDTWHVAPVRVSGVWYADAKFTHARHTTIKCADCHVGAPKSKQSSDLLIPGIANCRTCHGGAKAKNKVATTCIACHDYHQSATLKMGTL